MKYKFDEKIERIGNHSAKWEEMSKNFGTSDLIPMWIADMEFKTAPEIIKALSSKVEYGIFGYVHRPDSYYESVIKWSEKRFKYKLNKKTLINSPGVVPTLSLLIRLFTKVGENILIQTPVYYPFFATINSNNRKVIQNKLKRDENGYYTIDFADFEKQIVENNIHWFILCSPHNPVGRVWTRDELQKMADICFKYKVRVIADEIWRDLVLPGNQHTPFASLSKEIENLTITCFSASKTFNLAGLQASFVSFPRKDEWNKFDEELGILDIKRNSPFSIVAFETAYSKCEDWLEELLIYLDKNMDFAISYIKEKIPEIKVKKPEGTYLLWLDFSELKYSKKELEKFIKEKAKIALDPGYWFGDNVDYYERMNVACPKSMLEEALKRLEKAIVELRTLKK
ncbi:MalY/PatB family protein [Oceanivirga salmonicida]|uniref:MalY/PatB family protein n=1 Tax=Oceanivirga salmonicida TaxID=1769291 RepID=UPI0012E19A7C|nr:MalY/PatB family protein [Oceanivirga salmonicida]